MAVIQTDLAVPAARPAGDSRLWRYIRRHATIIVGGILLLIMVAMAVFAPWLGTVDPQALSPIRRLRPPQAAYWVGTDMLRRDVYGARISLVVGLSVAVFSSLTGLVIGLVTGFSRIADGIVMRIMDGLM